MSQDILVFGTRERVLQQITDDIEAVQQRRATLQRITGGYRVVYRDSHEEPGEGA